jgi:Bax protein
MYKIFVPLFLMLIIILSVAIQADTKVTAADLDMNNLRDVNDKKKRFFDFLRPVVIDENNRILEIRNKLLEAKCNNDNQLFVARIAQEYSVNWKPGNKDWGKLLERVDSIPLELSLAQSATESAWGQSRFAVEGNNFFGQWCYRKGCGLVPQQRDRGSFHEVARFDSVNDSVRSYLKTINTGRAYATLRKIRKQHRTEDLQADANAQAAGLSRYSQRRSLYIRKIRAIIKENQELMLGDRSV